MPSCTMVSRKHLLNLQIELYMVRQDSKSTSVKKVLT